MMRLLLNGLAASAGGGLTYLRNVIPHFAARTDIETIVALNPDVKGQLGDFVPLSFVELNSTGGAVKRYWLEQRVLPKLVRELRTDILISAGNFSLRSSPVPQILLSRNALYTCPDFYRDLLRRREYALWLDTHVRSGLARRSIAWADCTVAPSEAFARELRRWTGREVIAIHHGFDRRNFFCDHRSLPTEMGEKLGQTEGSLRLLLVSHYNYYRNFETLLRALPLVREQLAGRDVKLFLTCRLEPGANPGSYRTAKVAALVSQLGIGDNVVELDHVPYSQLHHLYSACDIYVAPAYAESFAHPLVEAMASGLPVVASDIAVHREICGDAAVFFPRFSPRELAAQILHVAQDETVAASVAQQGLRNSERFSWSRHVDQIISLAKKLKGVGENVDQAA
ncbi:MAG TPA: glycosyltransferase family 1 protein [Terriglobales bacterium]|nr:glycosyltransferase family 1 protein [Terriglobales bacterium]